MLFLIRRTESASNQSRINAETKEQLVSRMILKKKLDNHVFQALYTKLFMVLGILWVCESFHSIIHDGGRECKRGSLIGIFFTVIDCFNSLRGLFMFLIFICKKSVWVQMKLYYASKRQDRRHDQGNKNR